MADQKATASAAQSDSESAGASGADSAEETALHSDEAMDSKKALASEPAKAKEMVPETVTRTAGCLARQMALG